VAAFAALFAARSLSLCPAMSKTPGATSTEYSNGGTINGKTCAQAL
jgi:hypothetical protein